MPRNFHALRKTLMAAALLFLAGDGVSALPQEAPRAAGPPYRVGAGVSRPEILSSVRPVYTELARRARVTGTVILEATIDEQGNVTNTRILKGLPMGLDLAAVEAVQQWKFQPATLEGRPVPVYYVLTVNFQVEGSSRFGPRFVKFLEQNPEFAALWGGRRFAEAAELLDRWSAERPADFEISLARTHLLLEQGRLKEAWEEALSYRGPDPYEILHSVGVFAWSQASSDTGLDTASRAEIIELGLQAETMAMEAKVDGYDAIVFKSQLLAQKAQLTTDPGERQALLDQASQLNQLVRDLQLRLRGTGTGPEGTPERQEVRREREPPA